MAKKEIWKDIVGFEGLYQVSNLGRVKSLEYQGHKREKILCGRKDKDGYLMIQLWNGNKKPKYGRIHRLVALAFIPNPEHKPYIDHIDTDVSNNCVSNLRWCSQKENVNNPITKKRYINRHCIKCICEETQEVFESAKEAAEHFGFKPDGVSAVCRGDRKTIHGYHFRRIEKEESL